MNTKQIAGEAAKQIAGKLKHANVTSLWIEDIIKTAIEKATEEGVEIGSMLMAGAVVKAFTEGGRFGFTDENDPRYKLNQILDSSAAHASEQELLPTEGTHAEEQWTEETVRMIIADVPVGDAPEIIAAAHNAAIEKARKLQMDEDDAMWSAKLEAESRRAAHASERWTTEQVITDVHGVWSGLLYVVDGNGRKLGSMNQEEAKAVVAAHNRAAHASGRVRHGN